MATPPDAPVSDIVAMPSRSSIDPPTQAPGRWWLSPEVGGETWQSSGWISGQW